MIVVKEFFFRNLVIIWVVWIRLNNEIRVCKIRVFYDKFVKKLYIYFKDYYIVLCYVKVRNILYILNF